MPQLDTVTFLSQLFWLVIIFGAFYLTVLTDILPSFSRVLKSRLKKLKSNENAMYSLGDEKGETSSLYDGSLSTGIDGSRSNLLEGLNSGSALMKDSANSAEKNFIGSALKTYSATAGKMLGQRKIIVYFKYLCHN
jgi:hypothetical protein